MLTLSLDVARLALESSESDRFAHCESFGWGVDAHCETHIIAEEKVNAVFELTASLVGHDSGECHQSLPPPGRPRMHDV